MAARSWRGALAIGMCLAAGAPALAQTRGWTVTPSIAVQGTYTDNANLAAAPTGDEFIMDVSPAVSIDGRGPRLKANLSYAAHALFYTRRREEDRIANTLAASANLEALENFFFIDGQASILQTYASPFAPRPSDITTATANRAETRTLSLSPYLRGQFAGGHVYELRNRNTWTGADNEAVAKIHTRQWSGSVASPVSLFGWTLDANDTHLSQDDPAGRPDQDSTAVRGRLIFQPDSALRFYASAGREKNNFSLQEKRTYDTYGYGAQWQPTPRTTTAFDWEHRFFGTAKSLSFAHRTRLSAWSAVYSRDITTYQQEVLRTTSGDTRALFDAIFAAQIADPVARARAVDEFLRLNGLAGSSFVQSSVFFIEQVFLQERLEGSVALLGARNSVSLSAFRSRSTAIAETVGAGILSADGSRVDQHGFSVAASHRLTGFTSVNATANRTFAEAQPTAVESRNDSLTLGLSHTVSPKTSTFAGASYIHFDSSAEASSRARSVFAGFSHRF